jgi:hypothetical protein
MTAVPLPARAMVFLCPTHIDQQVSLRVLLPSDVDHSGALELWDHRLQGTR